MAVSMTQLRNGEEWLEHRKKYIGGSDASCIVGMNPFKSNLDLWEEKTGKREPDDLSDNPFVRYGSEAEKYLRELFRLDFPEYEVRYAENNSFMNDRFPSFAASLDGWLTDEEERFGILEIKTTTILQSMQKEKWKDRVPDNYYCQVLWYMGVLEADFAILKAQLRYDYGEDVRLVTNHYRFDRADVLEDIEYLMEKGKQFAEYVRNDERPPLVLPVL